MCSWRRAIFYVIYQNQSSQGNLLNMTWIEGFPFLIANFAFCYVLIWFLSRALISTQIWITSSETHILIQRRNTSVWKNFALMSVFSLFMRSVSGGKMSYQCGCIISFYLHTNKIVPLSAAPNEFTKAKIFTLSGKYGDYFSCAGDFMLSGHPGYEPIKPRFCLPSPHPVL